MGGCTSSCTVCNKRGKVYRDLYPWDIHYLTNGGDGSELETTWCYSPCCRDVARASEEAHFQMMGYDSSDVHLQPMHQSFSQHDD